MIEGDMGDRAEAHEPDHGRHDMWSDWTDRVRHAWDDAAAEGRTALDRVADELRRPTTGAALAGGAVVGTAALVGLGPTLVGAATAYVVFHNMKKHRSAEG